MISTRYDATCWFHFTRLPSGTDFSRGLRPLKQALPDILEWFGGRLEGHATADEWLAFETAILGGHLDAAVRCDSAMEVLISKVRSAVWSATLLSTHPQSATTSVVCRRQSKTSSQQLQASSEWI